MEVVISKPAKQTKGRMKIPIKKILNKNKKHVTFSKRRNGLFKKASELCVLCGASVAIVTMSEAGKVFTFGHPTVDGVFRRYLYGGDGASSSDSQFKDEDEDEKMLWWERPVEEIGFEELESYAAALERIKAKVEKRITDLDLEYLSVVKADQYEPNPFPIQAMAPEPLSNEMVNCQYNNFNYGVLDGGISFGSPGFVSAAPLTTMGQNQYWGCVGDVYDDLNSTVNRSGYGFGDYYG